VGDDSGLEIKAPNKVTHLNYLRITQQPPAQYSWQVFGSMLVTDRSSWWFCSFNPEMPEPLRLHFYKIDRDEAQIDLLRAGIKKFNEEVDAEVEMLNRLIKERLG
jgi:hypothetical protein